MLKKGDIIGPFSVLTGEPLYFSATANSNVKIATLHKDFLLNPQTKIANLRHAVHYGL